MFHLALIKHTNVYIILNKENQRETPIKHNFIRQLCKEALHSKLRMKGNNWLTNLRIYFTEKPTCKSKQDKEGEKEFSTLSAENFPRTSDQIQPQEQVKNVWSSRFQAAPHTTNADNDLQRLTTEPAQVFITNRGGKMLSFLFPCSSSLRLNSFTSLKSAPVTNKK